MEGDYDGNGKVDHAVKFEEEKLIIKQLEKLV
jgi:hypothetical protein